MKTLIIVFLIALIAVGLIAIVGCLGSGKFGAPIASHNLTKIQDILTNPSAYNGKIVTIEGKIANECNTGCWFYVKVSQGEANIYVDLLPAGFAIPQNIGKLVTVEGKVVIKQGRPIIEGKGVQVR